MSSVAPVVIGQFVHVHAATLLFSFLSALREADRNKRFAFDYKKQMETEKHQNFRLGPAHDNVFLCKDVARSDPFPEM